MLECKQDLSEHLILEYILSPCINMKTFDQSEDQSISGIFSAVKIADKLMKAHCFASLLNTAAVVYITERNIAMLHSYLIFLNISNRFQHF